MQNVGTLEKNGFGYDFIPKKIIQIINYTNKNIIPNSPPSMAEEDKKTSHNIRYTLRRSSGLTYEKPQSAQ
ncbi:hypothetical protein FACS189476_00320 [Spirochaetia bacterium]|nr:hypothetical protein FACS189476_00320 [Spirochaetia bacterium]